MSAKATAWAWQQPELSHTTKLVLLAYADAADSEDCAAIVREKLEHLAGVSETTARKSVAELAEKGFLEKVDDVIRRDTESGQSVLVPLYRIAVD